MTARGCLWHRRSPLKRSTGRPSRQPVEPELQKETDGRIDRSEVRDTPWDPLARKGRWFVWNSRRGNHLGQRPTKPHQQAGHMDASDPIRPSKTLAARGPSTYGSRIAFAALTCSGRQRSYSIRSEHEPAVAFEIRPGAHVELAVLADEEQRALRHFLRALQQQAGIVGAHLVGKRLALLVVAVAPV